MALLATPSVARAPVRASYGLARTVASPPSQVVPSERSWATVVVKKDLGPGYQPEPVHMSGTRFAYLIAPDREDAEYSAGHLERLDLATGQTDLGAKVPAGSALGVVDGKVLVAEPRSTSEHRGALGPWRLRQVVGRSTELGPALTVPWSGPGAAQVWVTSSPVRDDVWMADGDDIELVDLALGHRYKQVDLGAPVSSVATSPDGRWVYADLNLDLVDKDPKATEPSELVELNAQTGRDQAHAFIASVGWADLTAVPGGVWASYRGGMAGTSTLYRSPSLAQVAPDPAEGQFSAIPRYGSGQIMGVWAFSTGGALLLWSDSGASCLAPGSGRFLAGHSFRDQVGWEPFASWDGLVYGTGLEQSPASVLAVRLPSSCGLRG